MLLANEKCKQIYWVLRNLLFYRFKKKKKQKKTLRWNASFYIFPFFLSKIRCLSNLQL